jgi:tetratricopeptide (TPR) repeat protein
MRTETIEDLAYLISEAKNNGAPKPIVFLGAGASVSGGIPLAKDVAAKILEDFADNPKIKKLKEEEKENYALLMDLITPAQRNKLLKDFVDNAKVNVTHIYLAQMMLEGYIDYFLTVNFDNLMQRALALFNTFPPIYDVSNLNLLTTTVFHNKSITYLHGQHNGQWLLNTKDELNKPKSEIAKILNQIKSDRIWIILGYSGSDPIIDHLAELGRFDNGLYWIGYKDDQPNERVNDLLLNKPILNAQLIQGHDSDSFCLKLNTQLGLKEPQIFNTPFSFLHDIQNNIVDIEDIDTYKNVKERLELSKQMVNDAIKKYEKQETSKMSDEDIAKNNLKKEILNAIAQEFYNEADYLLEKSKNIQDNEIKGFLSELFSDWGITIENGIKNLPIEEQEKHFELAFEKYEKAVQLNNKNHHAYYNWGTSLGNLALITSGDKQKKFFELSFEKFEKATELNSEDDNTYFGWGTNLGRLAKSLPQEEQKKHLVLAFEKYKKAIEINPRNADAYINWGVDLGEIARIAPIDEQKNLFELAFEKYEKAVKINPKKKDAYNNWGADLAYYAKQQNDPLKKDLLNQSLNKLKLATGKYYNLSCLYALLDQKKPALENLELSLKNNQIDKKTILGDDDWQLFFTDPDFISLIEKY